MFPDRNIHYDVADKVRGGRFGGLGACLLLVKRLDLAGKTLLLAGPALAGGTLDVKQFRGKLVCVFNT